MKLEIDPRRTAVLLLDVQKDLVDITAGLLPTICCVVSVKDVLAAQPLPRRLSAPKGATRSKRTRSQAYA